MAQPPLPDNPSVRVQLVYKLEASIIGGSRFFLNYAGSAPDASHCTTLAGDIATAWATNLAPLTASAHYLSEVDVLDIATRTGASGQWSGTHNGTRAGTALPQQCAANCEFNIAIRYRGGKPRMYLLPGNQEDLVDQATYQGSFVTAVNSGMTAFKTALEAISLSPTSPFSMVVISFVDGYNTNTPPWRGPGFKYPPAYRATAVSIPITGFSCKATIGSQRRRRTSTTP